MEPLMDVEELAAYLRQKKSWVYDNYRKLGIPHVKVGNSVRFKPAAVARWLEDHSEQG